MTDAASISVILAARNCAADLETCLASLSGQEYPRARVEVLVMDGGSTDGTRETAGRWNAEFVDAGYPDNQEARRFLGWQKAKNELILVLDTDNILPHRTWLREMVRPFEDPQIVAAQPLRYAHKTGDTPLNRYCALFGVNDPLPFYLHKADRLSYLYDHWALGGRVLEDRGTYYKVRFTQNDLPTVGSNGFFVRRGAWQGFRGAPEAFFHIDVNYDLLAAGHDTYGIVKTSIHHVTARDLPASIAKRVRYMGLHYDRMRSLRRYKVFDPARPRDWWHLAKFVVFALTLVQPAALSLKGWLRVRDRAWWLHPWVCLRFLAAYGGWFLRSRGARRCAS
ncbi:MAG: glycosyltransferase [Deltaproteobacteria bacterium]